MAAITEEQQVQETRTLLAISSYSQIVHDRNAKWPRSWSELRAGINEKIWHDLEMKFSKFGDRKGFTNSIFEKYVFVPIGVKTFCSRVFRVKNGMIF